jgi:hypothetical protein
MQHPYKVGDKVRILTELFSMLSWAGQGTTHAVKQASPDGVYVGDLPGARLFLYNHEVELVAEEPAQCIPMQQDAETFVSSTGGMRKNGGKNRVELIPPSWVLADGEVLTVGALKYADRNWEKGLPFSVCIGSLLRHALALASGEDRDPETGKPHAAHVRVNAGFLLTYMERIAAGTLPASLDDRVKP